MFWLVGIEKGARVNSRPFLLLFEQITGRLGTYCFIFVFMRIEIVRYCKKALQFYKSVVKMQ